MDAAFDTLSAARALEAADLPRKQAEAIVEVVRQRQDDLATKADVAALKSDINAVRRAQGDLATKADVAALKSDVAGLRWILGVVLAIALANTAAVVALALQ